MQNINLPPPKRNSAIEVPPKDRIRISASVLQRARERVGLDGESWQQMAWYVHFATLDFDNMSGGDLLNIQEEVIAISHNCDQTSSWKIPTREQLKPFQQEIAKCLKDINSAGGTVVGPISYTLLVIRPQYLNERISSPPEDPHLIWPQIATIRFISDKENPGNTIPVLRYYFAKLLPDFANSLLPCPKCQKIFLQFRRHAKFCSRQCQSQRAAEVNREKIKARESKAKLSQKKRTGSVTKRRK
jgi:hypothetical protein